MFDQTFVLLCLILNIIVCVYKVTINQVEESEVNFVELVHALLEDPSERKYFFEVRHACSLLSVYERLLFATVLR